MTPTQRELARHALGLDGRRRQAYRNYFVASPGHDDFDDWKEMVKSGLAVRGSNDTFYLTSEAGLAIDPNESIAGVLFPARWSDT